MTTTNDNSGGSPDQSPQVANDSGAMSEEQYKHLAEELRLNRTRKDSWAVLIAAISAVAVIASVIGVGIGLRALDEGGGSSSGSGGGGATSDVIEISMNEFSFSPNNIVAAEGATLSITNDGSVAHNFEIPSEGLASGDVNAGATGEVSLAGLAPGTYNIVCTVAGHEDAGMTGTVKIVEAGSDEATTGSEDEMVMTNDEMDAMMKVRTDAFLASVTEMGDGVTTDASQNVLEYTVAEDGAKEFNLTASIVDWEVEPGKVVKGWAYNGMIPGPTIKINTGDHIRVNIKNDLPESTAIHWHGVLVPVAEDGVPDITQEPIRPDESYTYEFIARETMVGMYHSHHNAAHQVVNGLIGTIIVDQIPMPDGLPVDLEYPMMLNDAGTIGFSLNGKSFPATEPIVVNRGDRILVHYLNEGLMPHPMHLHGMHGLVVAKDGVALEVPYMADTVNVAPGERYSVLITATEVGAWAWHCHILTHAETSEGMFGMVTALVVKDN